jgi:hypothetical protein
VAHDDSSLGQSEEWVLRIPWFLDCIHCLEFYILENNVLETGCFHPQMRGGRHLICSDPYKGLTSITGQPMLKLKLIYDRQSVLVSDTHLGPATNFSFSLKFSLGSSGLLFRSALSDERTCL